ncbi:hypothetical protein DDB_G0280673 [Dictyostelium discoideum AX4]|uniref:Uncharacterized protein n=1 Tax=Dictyostelium discoideum TaxID=44689 RepID=Q54V16_DICDI|nr:hypothetical protein DDB_G0280673 [Dictyostelium discoideum AX4]EAL67138.1 hypothetical protein DDB_G0280673 [Dictyostelium discoideum AX4]|eukprot:XP_641115.1 hypothetical protein DDB_G0280673 [Dictyostelium discoideum AX4]
MSKLIINPENINVKEVKTRIKVAKTITNKKEKKSNLSKKQINIPIPESLSPTFDLLGVSGDGEVIDLIDLDTLPQVKQEPVVVIIDGGEIENKEIIAPSQPLANLVSEVPFYKRGDLQIVGGILAISALGYVIYRYWPSSAVITLPSTVKSVVKEVIEDSVVSTL